MLHVFSDGPARPEEKPVVDEVRRTVRETSGFAKVVLHERESNAGLAMSIISGVDAVLNDNESIIVLEDDLETSPAFLAYMNAGLEQFAHDERVISIHAYVYPVGRRLPPAFFLRGADCWGWATWRRGWKIFERDGARLHRELTERRLSRVFDFDGTYPYAKTLRRHAEGAEELVDVWAIRWYASAFLAGKLTLYPGRALVRNFGFDGSGAHSRGTDIYDVELAEAAPDLRGLVVRENRAARAAIKRYFRTLYPGRTLPERALRKLRRIVGAEPRG